ncbi:hypothetical protein [Schleiferilactobacillus harbinensis]|uniref:hypothetical protein n=1 Tax=Schleiferilactobacillus harbinensis TaxID=304207 RepID=UPI0039E922C3
MWAILPIWLNGIRGGYDPNFHMGRIMALADGIRAGHFPNPIGYRYLQGMGYGIGFFYGNFWLYPAAFFVVQGAAVGQVYTVLLCVLVGGCDVVHRVDDGDHDEESGRSSCRHTGICAQLL